MEFRLLGPLEVLGDDGAPIPLGGKRPRALLALLLLHAERGRLTDRLIDGVWGEHPPASAQSASRCTCMPSARRSAPTGSSRRPPGYAVRVDAEELDVDRFERLVADGDPTRAALALWRGPALADFAGEPFARADAARLEEARLAALEARIAADLAAGRHTEVVPELDTLVKAQPSPRALSGPAHACALPIRPSGRCACRVSRRPDGAGRPRAGAVSRAAHTRAADPPARSRAGGAGGACRSDSPRVGALIGRDLELAAIARCSAGPTCAWSR